MGCACSSEDWVVEPNLDAVLVYEINVPGVREGNRLSGNPGKRLPKHIFSITFTDIPLGFMLSSNFQRSSAYVIKVDGTKNEAVQDNKLPLNSKLLRCNGVDIESANIDDIEKTLVLGIENLPLILTFCHPDGLHEDEHPDSNAEM